MLSANWTLIAVFDPLENALGVEFVPALQHVLGRGNLHFL